MKDRYSRNIGTIGEDGQKRLFASHVAIAGAGGLGGTVFEILLRYGIGRITVVDFDSFERTNLNRQLLSTEQNMGEDKAEAAAKRAALINSDVEVMAVAGRLTDANAKGILDGADIICDCLGNIRDRFVLERAARELGVPMVHAAIAGVRGQLTTILPGGKGLSAIYGDEREAPASGEEAQVGTPPASVMAVASLQAHEAIATLLAKPSLAGELLKIDLCEWKFKRFDVG